MSLSKQVTRPLFKLAVLKRFKQQKPLPFEGARTFCTCAVIQSCHFFCLCQGGRRSGGPRSGDASSFEGAELEALAALQAPLLKMGARPAVVQETMPAAGCLLRSDNAGLTVCVS